jgi:putative ABC transport system permease protein
MDILRQDLAYAFRLLIKNPLFSLATVLVFALGIGLNVAVFTLVNAVLLRPLAYSHPDRLVVLLHEGVFPVSPADYLDYRKQSGAFDVMGAAQAWGANLASGSRPEAVPGLRVTSSLFQVLGVSPLLGRTFNSEEERTGAAPVLVLSYELWQTRFGGAREVIGQKVQLDGTPFTIIGVMPQSFHFAPFWATQARMWTTLPLDRPEDRGARKLRIFARLKRGVAISAAASEMSGIARRLAETYPDTNKNLGISVVPLKEKVVGQIRPTLMVLMGTVAFVLLIACANIANFALARVLERQREFALRKAVGASQSRLVRMLFTELAMLGLIGGVAGVLIAYWSIDLLPHVLPLKSLPRLDELSVDVRTLLFAVAATLASVVIAGLTPVLRLAQGELAGSLREGSRGATGTGARRSVRSALIAAEVALSLMLLTGAGLMIRSMQRLGAVNAGFDPHNLLTFQVSLRGTVHDRDGARLPAFTEIQNRLAAIPGVAVASAINHLPISGDSWSLSYQIAGRPASLPGEAPSALYRVVMPGYFNAMKIGSVRGRVFTSDDRLGTPGVAVINEAMALRQWPGQNPLGQRIRFGSLNADNNLTIVGVVRNAKQADWAGAPSDEIYVSYLQRPDSLGLSYLTFVLRTGVRAENLDSAVLASISGVDKGLAVSQLETMEHVVRDSLWRSRLLMTLLSVFAAISMALAAIGIYGVTSYAVKQRTQEIGIRLALGATPASVLQLALYDGMRPIAAGAILGLAAALALTRFMNSLLYGITATDPTTFAFVLALLTGTATLAVLIPARNAARMDPMLALRNE